MEDHVNSRFSAQDWERQGDAAQRNISPVSRASFVSGRGKEPHERMEERKQDHLETEVLQDHGLNMLTKESSNRWSRIATYQWIWELCALLVSLLSLVAIVLILRLREERPLPDWPVSITINALISIFATVMSATMSVPIAAGVSQAKWSWFQQYHALSDVEVYDQASRGPWGALKMLWNIRWRHMSSLGALITILALAIHPFVQQVASYPLELVVSAQNSTLPVLLSTPAFELKGPVYSGLFGLGNFTQTPHCPTGNCTWAPYQTLAVCSQCVDIAEHITYTESNKQVSSCDVGGYETPCLATLPNGLSIGFANNSDMKVGDPTVLNTSGMLPPITLDKVGFALAHFSLMAGPDGNGGSPLAIECSLYWCVNTYTAVVNNTIFTEYSRSSWYNATSILPLADLKNALNIDKSETFYNITPPTGGAKTEPNVNETWQEQLISDSDMFNQEDYIVSTASSSGQWLGPLLSGNRSILVPASDVVTLFNSQDLKGISTIFARVAQYLTVAYRSFADADFPSPGTAAQALGVAWETQVIVKVRWAWLSLPCALLAASVVFLGATMLGNTRGRVGVWKSNTLALLFHGPPGSCSGGGVGHVLGMEQRARGMWVRLMDDGDGKRLVEKHGLPNLGD